MKICVLLYAPDGAGETDLVKNQESHQRRRNDSQLSGDQIAVVIDCPPGKFEKKGEKFSPHLTAAVASLLHLLESLVAHRNHPRGCKTSASNYQDTAAFCVCVII